MDKTLNNNLNFTGRNVPVAEVAKATGKSAQYIRAGLQQGILKFGFALKVNNSSRFDYYIPDYLLYQYTGYYNPNAKPEYNMTAVEV